MEYNKNLYCTVGEFAKLCGVNKQTLQYYDQEQIFCPEFIDENGYRYYSFRQLDLFRILSALKAVHTPLKTIRQYLYHRSRQELLSLLLTQQQKIQEEIQELELANQIIETKVAQAQFAQQTDFTQIKTVHLPQAQLVLSEELHYTTEKQYSDTIAAHIHFCKQHNLNVGNPIGSIISYEKLLHRQWEFSYWFTEINQPYNGPYAFTRPAGQYVIGYYNGYYGTNTAIYPKLMQFIRQNQLTIIGHAYENSVIDMFMTENYDEYVTEVAIHVHPSSC